MTQVTRSAPGLAPAATPGGRGAVENERRKEGQPAVDYAPPPGRFAKAKMVFRRFSSGVAWAVGSPVSFLLAVAIVVAWALMGPHYKYSDTWQLVINTGTTIVTFLMVFLIQNTQNRDAKAIHLKLDELIRAVKGARTGLVNLESMTDEQLEALEQQFRGLHERHQKVAERLSATAQKLDGVSDAARAAEGAAGEAADKAGHAARRAEDVARQTDEAADRLDRAAARVNDSAGKIADKLGENGPGPANPD